MQATLKVDRKSFRLFRIKTWLPVAAAACSLLGLAVTRPAAAQSEKFLTTPTAWWWYQGVTPDYVTQKISDNNARIVSLEVQSASPLKFTVAMVKNQGDYAKGWWWYYGLTADQVTDKLNENHARILDLAPYRVGTQQRFAVVMVPNTGADAKTWWWYWGVSTDYIADRLAEHNARLMDIDTWVAGGKRYYSAVMIKNQGVDMKGWWWYYNVSPDFIADKLTANHARLVTMEPHGPGTFTCIMVQSEGKYWWWYYDQTATGLLNNALQNGARLIDVKAYSVGGQKRFVGVMLDNANAQTRRIERLLSSSTDGARGLYVKQVGGPVYANLLEQYVFEPASAIKVIHHLHAMRRVDAGAITLNTQIKWFQDYEKDLNGKDTSCPQDTNPAWESLENALKQMMWNSDNRRAQAIRVKFGQANINATAKNVVGMLNTNTNHRLGCGSEEVLHPNHMTLYDAGLLYEGVANGSLLSASAKSKFYALMAGKAYDFTGVWGALQPIIDAEGAAEGLSASQIASFKSLVKMSYKAGGYTINSKIYRALAGWVQLPFKSGAVLAPRQFVFGIFNDKATVESNANIAFDKAKAEILREQVRAALKTW